MQPSQALTPEKKVQQRLKKFIRQPELLADRQLTEKGIDVIAAIERYRFIPSSLLVRLVDGGQRNNYRHLQTLFHKGVINRFALPKYGGPGEFIYYLDSTASLSLLVDHALISADDKKQKERIITGNRETNYANLHRDPDVQGKLLFVQHELMVSRFHWLVDMACKKFAGKIFLEQWKQGPELWNRVEVPKVKYSSEAGQVIELDKTEALPHRPDAFFTLRFPTKPEGQQFSHFMYEADRGTENTTRFKMKLRAHYHAIVKQQLQRTLPCYNVHSIRAVLVESTTSNWAHNLREAARHPVVSPRPSSLFWFTTSELFTKLVTTGVPRPQPLYLTEPEHIFKRIWASPAEEKFLNLAD
jgi:hypothetical protein